MASTYSSGEELSSNFKFCIIFSNAISKNNYSYVYALVSVA